MITCSAVKLFIFLTERFRLSISLKIFAGNNAIKHLVLVVQAWKPQGCWSRVGKQLAGKYPLDTSRSCGKIWIFLLLLCVRGWLIGWLVVQLVGLLIA